LFITKIRKYFHSVRMRRLVREFTIYVNHNYSLDLILFQPRRKLRRARISIIGHASVSLHTALFCPLPFVPLLRTRFKRCHFTSSRSILRPPPLSAVRTLTLQCPVFNFADIEKPFHPCILPGASYRYSRTSLTTASS